MARPTLPMILVALTSIGATGKVFSEVPEGLFGPARSTTPTTTISENEEVDVSRESLEAALSEGGVATDSLSEKMLQGYEIADMEPIPSPQMIAVEDKRNGKMGFLSANGRFYIEGTIVDLWNGKHLKTVSEVRESRQTVDAKALNFPEKATFKFGKGKHDVVIFSDPHCDICQGLLVEAREIAKRDDDYTFNIIQVPAHGESSLPAVQKMWCGGAEDQVLLEASISGDVSSFQDKADCDFKMMGNAFVSADMLGVDAVPTLIAPDGHLARGLNESLEEYLAEHTGEAE